MKRIIKDNKGFTLVELLVSLLVSSMVILAATLLLTVSANSFNSTNSEVNMQMESQIALNLVENLMLEATSCEYDFNFAYDDSDSSKNCMLIKIGSRVGSKTYMHLVFLNAETNKLLVKVLEGSLDETENYENIIGNRYDEVIKTTVSVALASNRPALLADYVADITVEPSKITTNTNDLVRVNIKLEQNGKSYTSSANISMRNGLHR